MLYSHTHTHTYKSTNVHRRGEKSYCENTVNSVSLKNIIFNTAASSFFQRSLHLHKFTRCIDKRIRKNEYTHAQRCIRMDSWWNLKNDRIVGIVLSVYCVRKRRSFLIQIDVQHIISCNIFVIYRSNWRQILNCAITHRWIWSVRITRCRSDSPK